MPGRSRPPLPSKPPARCRPRRGERPPFAHSGRPELADIVEKLEFPRRSQLRRPLAASREISLGAQRSDRFFCVRPSLSPCCGKHPWRQRFPRGSGIFAAPQFPTFSTISTLSGHADRDGRLSGTEQRCASWERQLPSPNLRQQGAGAADIPRTLAALDHREDRLQQRARIVECACIAP